MARSASVQRGKVGLDHEYVNETFDTATRTEEHSSEITHVSLAFTVSSEKEVGTPPPATAVK
jgi:hypothetical protein